MRDWFQETWRVLTGYVGGQALIAIIQTGIYALGFGLLGMPFWPLVALFCGFLNLVPMLGATISLLLSTAVAWIGGSTYGTSSECWGVFVFGQALEGFYLTPTILGHRTGLRPPVVFFSILIAGLVFGPWGVLLAVPALALARVAWKHSRRVPPGPSEG